MPKKIKTKIKTDQELLDALKKLSEVSGKSYSEVIATVAKEVIEKSSIFFDNVRLTEQGISSFYGVRLTDRKDFRPDELAHARGLSRRTIDREIRLWEFGDSSHPKHTAGLGPVRRLRRAVIIPAESVAAWDARQSF